MTTPPIALTIAGSDSGGGAGIQADLRTFALHGIHGTSVITALTAQNTLGVQAIHYPPTEFVLAQLDSVLSDLPIAGIKTGMLGDANLITQLANKLQQYSTKWLIVDPVMVSTSGQLLLPPESTLALKTKLLPLATLITPNLHEAEHLLADKIATDHDARQQAAEALQKMTGKFVLLKGGHATNDADDVLVGPNTCQWFHGKRVATPHTHGTGCHLSAAILSLLILGKDLPAAITQAKAWLTRGLAQATQLGQGHAPPNVLAINRD